MLMNEKISMINTAMYRAHCTIAANVVMTNSLIFSIFIEF